MDNFNITLANGLGFLVRVRTVNGQIFYDLYSEPVLHGTLFNDGSGWKSNDCFTQLVVDLIGALIDQQIK